MNKKKWLSILLCLMLVFTCVTPVFADTATTWTAEDFTYGEESFELYPAGEKAKAISITAWVVTGLSESGTTKLATNTDIVIPAVDPNGKKVQGVGNSAFNKTGLTSVTFPENVMAPYDDSTWETSGKGLTQRGDFFIGASAFLGNALTEVELPEGVVYIGNNAFKGKGSTNPGSISRVKLPKTVMQIWNAAFGLNAIETVDFPEKTDFNLQIDVQAFAINKIKTVQLPVNVEKLNKWAFLQNTGMEPITSGTTAEMKGGLVYLYVSDDSELGSYIDTTVCHTFKEGKDPAKITNFAVKPALASTDAVYTGAEVKPAVTFTGYTENVDYTVAYKNNVEVGKAKAIVTGTGSYYGSIELEFNITAAAFPEDKASLEFDTADYTGSAIEPKVTVDGLTEGTDFTVEYKNNTEVGTATAVVTGIGNYEGSVELQFTIEDPNAGNGEEGGIFNRRR